MEGSAWRIGTRAEVAWIAAGTTSGPRITTAIPPIFPAYCTLGQPEPSESAQRRHDFAVISVLRASSACPQPWWLGYLETGIGVDLVFNDAPRVKLYGDWSYVLVEAGPEQAVGWRQSSAPNTLRTGPLPELIFPADRSWLVSTLWDDRWSCIGGSEALIATFLEDDELGPRVRRVTPDQDDTPPGYA